MNIIRIWPRLANGVLVAPEPIDIPEPPTVAQQLRDIADRHPDACDRARLRRLAKVLDGGIGT